MWVGSKNGEKYAYVIQVVCHVPIGKHRLGYPGNHFFYFDKSQFCCPFNLILNDEYYLINSFKVDMLYLLKIPLHSQYLSTMGLTIFFHNCTN